MKEHQPVPHDTGRFIGPRELHRRFGLERSYVAFCMWLRRQVRAGRFPKPIRLSERVRAWRDDDIAAYERQVQDRSQVT